MSTSISNDIIERAFQKLANQDDIADILTVVQANCIKRVLAIYSEDLNAHIDMSDIVFINVDEEQLIKVCDRLYQNEHYDELYKFVHIYNKYMWRKKDGHDTSSIVDEARFGIYLYILNRVYYAIPTAIISVEIVEKHLKRAYDDYIYMFAQHSLFQLICFKKELFKFCQNPDANFNDEAINEEINDNYLYYYFLGSSDRGKYRSYINLKELSDKDPSPTIRRIVEKENNRISQMMEQAKSTQITRLKHAVHTGAAIIRKKVLGYE